MKRIIATPLLAAAGLSLALGACSSGGGASKPSESAVATKLKADPDFKSTMAELSAKQQQCIVNLFYKYGSASSLSKYVSGKINLEQVSGSGISDKSIQSKAQACVS